MKQRCLCIALAMLSALSPAMAGDYQERLATCLTGSANQDDKDALIRWIFVAMAAHPLTEDLAAIPAGRRETIVSEGSAVFQKLMTETCGEETVGTLKYEGTEAFGKAFEVLGQTAMEGLMSHPDVDRAISELASHLDQKKFEELLERHDP